MLYSYYRDDKSACINRLFALEGVIQGVMESLLSSERKEEIIEFYNLHRK